MPHNKKNELEEDINHLYQEKIDLEEEIKGLNQAKIQKLQTSNNELQKRVDWLEKQIKKLNKDNENLERQIKHSSGKKWLKSLIMIIILGVMDLVIIPLLVILLQVPVQWMFISIGITTFFGILVISNYMSHTNPFDTGEVRKALTGAFILLYFLFVPLVAVGSLKLPTGQNAETIITDFSAIVIVIIGFYFGTRGLEEYRKIKEGKGKK